RVPRADEDAAALARRHRHVDDGQLTGLVVLDDLLHEPTPPTPRGRRHTPRYQYSRVKMCQRCLARSSRPALSSATSRANASRCRKPEVTSSPELTTSATSGARSRLIHARSGALNRPFGRCTISGGRIERAASLSAIFPCLPRILRAPGTANAAF